MKHHQHDKPFPLKKYYLVYAGLGGILFYFLLFSFFIHAERQVLYDQYIGHLTEKANILYLDINRDLLQQHDITLDDMNTNTSYQEQLRDEIDPIIQNDFALAKVKLFSRDGIILYDHADMENVGKQYDSIHEPGFITALSGTTVAKIENDKTSRFMEIYLPIFSPDRKTVTGILEVYEDVSRFEKQVYLALKKTMIVPTLIFIVFNIALFLIIAKADRIIANNTALLVTIRRNMEKYISPSATKAIYEAVTLQKELFQGKRQSIVVFFSDVRGFTSFSEENEPETVVQELNTLFELQADIIHAHGGIIDKFVGDEIMALFPPEKNVHATLAALEIIHKISEEDEIDFDIGIGVHAGDAVVGSIGASDRRDYTAIGNTVNTAARLCDASTAREVIVSDSIYRALPPDIRDRFSPTKQLQLKGKLEKIQAFSSLPRHDEGDTH